MNDLALLSLNNTWSRLILADSGDGAFSEIWGAPTASVEPAALAEVLAAHGVSADTHRLLLSSVVPIAEERLLPTFTGFQVTRISHQLRLNFSLETYRGRATLGADRIADMAAVAENGAYPLPALILDAGTAVTVDVLDADRRYLGGMIAPGLRLFADYLAERTAQLPRLDSAELSAPEGAPVLGQDTREALAAAARHGFPALCAGLLQAAARALPPGAVQSVIVTGGDAAVLQTTLAELCAALPRPIHVPALTFEGMRVLARLNP